MHQTISVPEGHTPSDISQSATLDRNQIVAFFTGALFVGVGLIVAFFMFVAPSVGGLDPAAAWCRGWIDGLSYTDFRAGNEYEPQTLDDAEARCRARYEAGLRAPAARGPLTAEDS
jgi:hypothetical protein